MNAILGRFSIRQQMAMILFAFLIPLCGLVFVYGHTMYEDYQFAESESKGGLVQKPVSVLLNEVADYQTSEVLAVRGVSDARASMDEGAKAIDQAFKDFEKVVEEHGDDFMYTDRELSDRGKANLKVAELETLWSEIRKGNASPEKYKDLSDRLVDVVSYVGDKSNLILDPELDSYYLVDVSVTVLPQMLAKIAAIKSQTVSSLVQNGNHLGEADKAGIELQNKLLMNTLAERLNVDVKTAVSEDKNFHGVSLSLQEKMPAMLEKYNAALAKMDAAISDMLSGKEMTPEAFLEIADVPHDMAADFSALSMDELETLLQTRMHDIKSDMMMSIGGAALCVLFAFTLFMVVSSNITGRISRLNGVMDQLSKGNIDVALVDDRAKDEIGSMSRTVAFFKGNMIEQRRAQEEQERFKRQSEEEKRQSMYKMADSFEKSVMGVVQGVFTSADNISHSAEDLSSTARQTTSQSVAVSSAAVEASGNVQTVAAAAEELSSSISEISRQVQDATAMAMEAVREASETNARMRALAENATKIGAVVSLINDIASQTNLLALNATIEAARAGDAGKGFAVVASEVKGLATQTTKATEDIERQVEAMQQSTNNAVTAIELISKTIERINNIQSGIAAAVEQQGAATKEISRNVQEASVGTNQVSENITDVTKAAEHTGSAANQMLQNSKDLVGQADMLRKEVETFLKSVRSA